MVVSFDSFKGVNERFNQIVSIALHTQIFNVDASLPSAKKVLER